VSPSVRNPDFLYSDEPGYAEVAAKVQASGGPGALFWKMGDPINRQAAGLPRVVHDVGTGVKATNTITPNPTQRAYLDIITGKTQGDVAGAYAAIFASLGFPGSDGAAGTSANVAYAQLVAGYTQG